MKQVSLDLERKPQFRNDLHFGGHLHFGGRHLYPKQFEIAKPI